MPRIIPTYRQRKGYDQAIVTLRDAITKRARDYWLGPYNTPQTQRNHKAVVTTEQLAAGRHHRRWLLPVAGAIQRSDVDLPLDPWLLGYWLGNGTAREGAISINQQDVPEAVAQIGRAGLDVGKPAVKVGCTTFTVLGLRVILRHMGLLQCKRIPEAYLLASAKQRAALLAGTHAD